MVRLWYRCYGNSLRAAGQAVLPTRGIMVPRGHSAHGRRNPSSACVLVAVVEGLGDGIGGAMPITVPAGYGTVERGCCLQFPCAVR